METGMLIRMVVGLLTVLGLIVLMAALLRLYGPRFGFSLPVLPASKRGRLSIVETRVLDARHRLVLLERDSTQHLVILGGASPVIVETGIADKGAGDAS